MKPALLKKQTSAGGVIYRISEDGCEVALVLVRGGTAWCLPKGLIDSGETPELAAAREVKEETGLNGRIICKLGIISYWYYIKGENTKVQKTVHFYLMVYISGSTADHDFEVDKAEWFPIKTALKKISFKGDRSILEKARTRIEEMNLIR